jgi:hypothetical protein
VEDTFIDLRVLLRNEKRFMVLHFTILPCWAFFRDSVFLYFITYTTNITNEKLVYKKRKRKKKESASEVK